jgi:hypothetical protein
MQSGLRHGDSARSIALAGPVTFPAQVVVNGEDLAPDCPYLKSGKQTVAARIQFVRVGSVGGLPVSGLSNGFSVTVTTEQNSATSTSGFSKNVSLVPGYYDIYAQPISSKNCEIAPKLWRGVAVARDGQVLGWAPPATLELPTPIKVNGRVQRTGGADASLADWQVEIVDPVDSKVVSTSGRLGATSDVSPYTNFEIMYQPLENVTNSAGPMSRGPAPPLIRLKPPKEIETTVPTVYFDLGGLAGGTQINVDLSAIPTAAQLVTVTGQVRGANGEGVRSTVKFFNTSFKLAGIPASFAPAVTTDAAGRYTARLFPADYRVVMIPEGASDNGSVVPGANSSRSFALTEKPLQKITAEPMQVVDLTVSQTRVLQGTAFAGAPGRVAQGATLELAPLLLSSSGVLSNVFSPPIAPARASVDVNDDTGKFRLSLDPGQYDLYLKPAPASNFAWWIFPNVTFLTAEMADKIEVTMNPQLFYPVPLGGTIIVVMPDRASQPLRNATVKAYAPSTDWNVTQVAIARTDDMGRYRLALPPGFGSQQ